MRSSSTPRIVVINPNTTHAMTEAMLESARAVAPDADVVGLTSTMGPASIESHYDGALSVPGLLQAVGSEPASDGFVVGCFGDPGLEAAREVATVPVIGIAEAGMKTASCLGNSFSVVTTLGRTTGRARFLAREYGLERQCVGVHACDLPVLALEEDRGRTYDLVLLAAREALDTDGSDAIVLGCAGMAWLPGPLSAALGVPVVDGVGAATATAVALARQGLRPAAHGELAAPPPKEYSGLLESFGTQPGRPTATRRSSGAKLG